MAKMQEPNPVFLERNKRFVIMRKHYFKRQEDAANFLGISQPMLSYIERGINDVNPSFVDKFVDELGASREWYTDGKGQVDSGVKKKRNPKPTLGELELKVERLERAVEMLRKNNNEMFRILDEIQKTQVKK